MNHVVGVKAVVAQFVYHDFVTREVFGARFINGELERCLGKAVFMGAVGHVPERRNGKDDADVGADPVQVGHDAFERPCGFFYRNHPAFKKRRVLPVAIRDGVARRF